MEEQRILKYLDRDLYVKSATEGDIEQHYICLICHGVVLQPTECREQLIKYSNYIKHFEECEHAEPKQECKHECEAKECVEQIKELQEKIEMLEIRSALQAEKIENYEQRLKLLEEQNEINQKKKIMKEIKKQIEKQKGNESKEEQKSNEINQGFNSPNSGEQRPMYGRGQVIPRTAINFWPAGRSDSSSSDDNKTCINNHPLKLYSDQRPAGLALSILSNLTCNICRRKINHNIAELYYRCDSSCNWDMCKDCYHGHGRQLNQFR
eukprot:403357505